MMRWPFAMRYTVDLYRAIAEQRADQNRLLRQAIRDANEELRRHRILLSTIRSNPAAAAKRIVDAFHGASPDVRE